MVVEQVDPNEDTQDRFTIKFYGLNHMSLFSDAGMEIDAYISCESEDRVMIYSDMIIGKQETM